MTDRSPMPAAPPAGRWYHGVWFVLLMLFVVMGPLALPLLWKSPRFSQTAKIVLTALVTAYTVWIVVASLTLITNIIHELQTMPMPSSL